VRRFAESLGYAAEGVGHAVVTQRNIRTQLGLLLGSLAIAGYCRLPAWTLLALGAVWTLVMVVELLNTALEELSEGLWGLLYHPRAKLVKDLAAGAVLLAATMAACVTAGLFWLYVDRLASLKPLVGWLLFGAVMIYAVRSRMWSSGHRRISDTVLRAPTDSSRSGRVRRPSAASFRPGREVSVASLVAVVQRWIRG